MKVISDFASTLGIGERAFSVMAKAKDLRAKGVDVIELEIGEPDFPVAPHIIEAYVSALQAGMTHYERTQGHPQLLEAVAGHVSRTRGVSVHPDEVVIFPGAKPAIYATLQALLDKNGGIIIPDPTYPVYHSLGQALTPGPLSLPLREENQFRFDHEYFNSISVFSGRKTFVYASPQNPTGGIFTRDDFAFLAEQKHKNITFIADEIYSRITYGDAGHESIYPLPGMAERTVLIDGFSKTYAMTGVRLGYAVVKDPEVRQAIIKIAGNNHGCVDPAKQLAGVAALTGPQDCVERMVAEFKRRRDAMVEGLNAIPGVSCHLPEGAFYTFPRMSGLMDAKDVKNSQELEERLLNEVHVAGLSGTSFGRCGEDHMRFSFANTYENCMEAVRRIRKWAEQ